MKLTELLKFLKCPYCDCQKLLLKKNVICCRKCRKEYDVVEGIPVLIKKENLTTQEAKQKEFFECHYSAFPKEKYRLENWRLSMLERMFGKVPQKKIRTYLDIGCGATGYTVIEAVKRNNWQSIGVDISLEAMVRARSLAKKQKVEDKTAFVVCSAENLPFKPGIFDYISAVSLLEHLDKDERAIKDISRILSKKGYLYICVPNTYKRMWPFLWPIYFFIDRWIGHKRHYGIELLKKKVSKEGFVLEDVFYNAHLTKLIQIILEKLRLINEKLWWKIERNDINCNSRGIQLNAIFQKKV